MPLGINPFCQEVFFYMAQIFVCGYYFPDNKLLKAKNQFKVRLYPTVFE